MRSLTKRSGKCLNCGKDMPSKCKGGKECSASPCPKCGTKYCGFPLGIPCRVAAANEPDEDARDVYGQKLSAGYRLLLKKRRAKYQKSIAEGGAGFVAGASSQTEQQIPTPSADEGKRVDLGKSMKISFSGVSGSGASPPDAIPLTFDDSDSLDDAKDCACAAAEIVAVA